MTELEFIVPGPDAPGYLRRQRKALEFSNRLTGDASPELLDELVGFLVGYITQPTDPEAAKEALWDASEDQFNALLDAISGTTGEVPDPEEDSSGAGSGAEANERPPGPSS